MTASACADSSLAVQGRNSISDDVEDRYIYTSVRYDPMFKGSPENTAASFNVPCPFYMLEHHWTRLKVAHWSSQFWSDGSTPRAHARPAEFIHSLLSAVQQWQTSHPKEAETAQSLRIRRRAYACGRVTTEIWQIPRLPLSRFFPKSLDPSPDLSIVDWTVVLDTQPTTVTEATMFKIWDRTPQVRARSEAGIFALTTTKEVLLYNPDHQILDGSNSTPYFYRKGRWVTPISSSGGLQGTTRRWALEKGLCIEAVISLDSFVDGEIVWFSNAVKGFFCAVYQAEHPAVEQSTAESHQRL